LRAEVCHPGRRILERCAKIQCMVDISDVAAMSHLAGAGSRDKCADADNVTGGIYLGPASAPGVRWATSGTPLSALTDSRVAVIWRTRRLHRQLGQAPDNRPLY
jgi:hypothetical protein